VKNKKRTKTKPRRNADFKEKSKDLASYPDLAAGRQAETKSFLTTALRLGIVSKNKFFLC